MKRMYIAIMFIIWSTIGITGAIECEFKYNNNELDVGGLTGAVFLGVFTGPVPWLIYALDNDVVLIKR